MILTCPSCTMRYIVSEGAIGPTGRKVRCASCGHEWQQQPEEGLDEALFGPDDDFDFQPAPPAREEQPQDDLSFMSSGGQFDETPPPAFVQEEEPEPDNFGSMLKREMKEDISIPEGVKPKPEDMVIPAARKKLTVGARGGFVAAALFYLALLGVFLLLQPHISRAWPASNLIYGWFGLSPALPGEGLALDGLEAKIAQGEIVMTGNIINLTNKPVKVPAIMAMIVDENEQVLEQVLIVPPSDTVDGEGQLAFDVTYPSIPTGALNVNFAFSYVKPKKEAEPEISEAPAPVEEGAEAEEDTEQEDESSQSEPSGH